MRFGSICKSLHDSNQWWCGAIAVQRLAVSSATIAVLTLKLHLCQTSIERLPRLQRIVSRVAFRSINVLNLSRVHVAHQLLRTRLSP